MLAHLPYWLSPGNTQRQLKEQSLQQLFAFQKLRLGSDFIKLKYINKKKMEEGIGDPSRFSMGMKYVSKYAHLRGQFWKPEHPDKCHLHVFWKK